MKIIALTVGPIYDTLKHARKTRELWAGSYLFSFLMKQIAHKLYNQQIELLIPFVNEDVFTPGLGAGLFPDRLIAVDSDNGLAKLNTAIQESIDELSQIIHKQVHSLPQQQILDQLKAYLQLYTLSCSIEGDDLIAQINTRLDTMELMHRFTTQPPKSSALELFFERINGSELKKDAFETKKGSFASLYEIAPADLLARMDETTLRKYTDNLDDDAFDPFDELKHLFGENLKQYHKYFVILRADGDRFGAHIETLKNDQKAIQAFSEKLFHYSKALPGIINDHGGVCVFAGGDDLLAFMPVVYKNKTILDAIMAIDQHFVNVFENIPVTLSFGASITYHKFPLYEALQMSYDALYEAKNQANQRNALCIKATKHSGQSFTLKLYKTYKAHFFPFIFLFKQNVYFKAQSSYQTYMTLLSELLTKEGVELPHAIAHKFDLLAPIILAESFELEQLPNLFKNFFNESEHKGKFEQGLDGVQTLMTQILQEAALDADAYKEPKQFKDDRYNKPYRSTRAFKLDMLLSAVSIIKLLRGDR